MLKTLKILPNGSNVVIDGTNNVRLDDDVREIIDDFKQGCKSRNIILKLKGFENIQPEDSNKAYENAIIKQSI